MEPVFFADAAELRAWFAEHHADAPELFVGYYKKHTGRPTVQHHEAIEQALCFGWIDSIGRRIDEDRYQVRFTPRRRGSVWSAINVAKIAELTAVGKMHPAGLLAFENRKPERVAAYSYEQPAGVVLDERQTASFKSEEGAWEWFSAQPASYRRAATHWVVSAKRADTRERRLAQLIADSAAGRTVPPLTRR
ncbi:YdeI/OmpD-associated family protein [Actinoplanes sp. NPDC005259]|uniref:YdeI/OmpD-associated family protein n=1 Tax=Actinoplanes sp. NPDC005259 TaxID=3154674 RepID=UPI0033AD2246